MLKAKLSAIMLSVLTASCHALPEKNWEIIEHVSGSLLGVTYGFSSSHDLAGPEQGDILNINSLDCMTFVALSIALADDDPQHWLKNWLTMRYADRFDFWGRRHFLSIDLNPTFESAFQLHDITTLFPKKLVKTHQLTVHKNSWLANQMAVLCRKQTCHTHDYTLIDHHRNSPATQVTISYIPYQEILHHNQINPDFLNRLPKMSIVEFVREGWPIGGKAGTLIGFSHLGFLIKQDNRLILRHAKWAAQTRDEDFIAYVKNIQGDPTHLGIHILH